MAFQLCQSPRARCAVLALSCSKKILSHLTHVWTLYVSFYFTFIVLPLHKLFLFFFSCPHVFSGASQSDASAWSRFPFLSPFLLSLFSSCPWSLRHFFHPQGRRAQEDERDRYEEGERERENALVTGGGGSCYCCHWIDVSSLWVLVCVGVNICVCDWGVAWEESWCCYL